VTDREVDLPADYGNLVEELKHRVRASRRRAQRTVNTELIELYWSIGQAIRQASARHGWGGRVIRRLGEDLRAEFPEMRGLSARNLQYMATFAGAWSTGPIAQQPVAQLPWGHVTVLLDKIEAQADRERYAAAACEHGWTRNVLANMVAGRALERAGAAPSNFAQRLVQPDSELAQQIAKDPLVLDFLDLSGEVAERELEDSLLDRITDTLRELGPGFAFVGRQVHFEVGGDDFHIDLLFFHVEQLRYVVIELKTGRFKPDHVGQLQFYVALVDDRLRREAHAPTVGILVCGSRNDHTVRYALNRAGAPMAVSTFTYATLPAEERAALPSEDELTAALSWDAGDAGPGPA
jgi:predicted nuclease of restriction endonuclease-like (RecB) superfamily